MRDTHARRAGWRESCVVTIGATGLNVIVAISGQLLDTAFPRLL